MAVDYQRILAEMNPERRRRESGAKKIFLTFLLIACLLSGGFAAWRFGIVGGGGMPESAPIETAVDNVADAASPQPVSAMLPSAEGPVRTTSVALRPPPPASQPAPAKQQPSMRPPVQAPAAPAAPVAMETAVLDVADMASPAPRLVIPGMSAGTASPAPRVTPEPPLAAPAAVASSAPPANSRTEKVPVGADIPVQTQPSPQQQLQAQAMATSSNRPQAAVADAAAVSEPAQPAQPVQAAAAQDAQAAVPAVLSDVKAQLRVIDQLLVSQPEDAMRRVDDLLATGLEPVDAAEAGYRKGYAARMLRDEATAERAWRDTVEKYPAFLGGRFSALALADTWYQKYAGPRPQTNHWEEISAMYSLVLGRDDAPFLPKEVREQVKARIGTVNDAVIFGSAPSKLAHYHRVESGELLGTIARRYRVDFESIARINGINPNRIHPGMDLKLVVGEVEVVVRKNNADRDKGPTVTWFLDGRWAREYPACVGEGVKTPPGSYTFTSKERDPSWTNPANGQLLPNHHPENILGSRWMAMKGMNTSGLGIHGTTVDDSVPGYTSAGCVRLHNRDVEELFSFATIGGKVTVLD